ncbi:MAG: hypothetical protein HGA67_02785 [Candidatus Yonathbacteria bacterium]|nr:hypothetical protein [Candidatus Yonathbacteria bacterium]
MITVELKNWGVASPQELTSFGALMCSSPATPPWREIINTKKELFDKGHHTTFQHFHLSFVIDGIAVGDVTFGLHLANVFYNTSQRSGRLAKDMFANPDIAMFMAYIDKFWPLAPSVRTHVLAYLTYGFDMYGRFLEQAGGVAARFLREERPHLSIGKIEGLKGKIAQEQMRMFIPVIFPTGLLYTLNLSALAAMHAVAWSPSMREVTNLMAQEVLGKWPELAFLFERRKWPDEEPSAGTVVGMSPMRNGVVYEPSLSVLRLDDMPGKKNRISSDDMHPLDLLPFSPEHMNLNVYEIKSQVEMSTATLGQKQRHRTIKRGAPVFTGGFYLPPILQELKLEHEASDMLDRWLSLRSNVPPGLFTILAPYGATVAHEEIASYNAVIHEASDRGCFKAQEEVYALSVSQIKQVDGTMLANHLKPPCVMCGVCGEGRGYCGRDLKKLSEDPFPKRRV